MADFFPQTIAQIYLTYKKEDDFFKAILLV